MPIKAKPIVVPEKVFDDYWVALFQSTSNGVGEKACLHSAIIPFNKTSGEAGSSINLDAIDVFAELAADADARVIYGLILAYLQKKAIEQGKLEADDVIE